LVPSAVPLAFGQSKTVNINLKTVKKAPTNYWKYTVSWFCNKENRTCNGKGETAMKAIALDNNGYAEEIREEFLLARLIKFYRKNRKMILSAMCSLNSNINSYEVYRILEK